MRNEQDLTAWCDEARTAIDARLSVIVDGISVPAELREAIRYSLLSPGKRVRPLLALMAADACGGADDNTMIAACAIEMVHAFSLIHDDLPALDNDDVRRGQPTSHKKFGEAQAILAGDALLALPFSLLATINDPQPSRRCTSILADAVTEMIGGQWDDIAKSASSSEDILHLHERKTGALIKASLLLGAVCARASSSQESTLARYGAAIGLAYQIVDDLLDEADSLGKEESTRRLNALLSEADAALLTFGEKATYLRQFAAELAARTH